MGGGGDQLEEVSFRLAVRAEQIILKLGGFKQPSFIFFSHQSAIWAGLSGDCASLLFATLSDARWQVESLLPCHLACMAGKLIQLGDKRQQKIKGESASDVKLGASQWATWPLSQHVGPVPRASTSAGQGAFSMSRLRVPRGCFSHLLFSETVTKSINSKAGDIDPTTQWGK